LCLLHSQGLDRNATGGVNDGALHAAARNGHRGVVKFLVEQRAEVNVKKTDGWAPLHLAAQDGHLDVAVSQTLTGWWIRRNREAISELVFLCTATRR
jgi:ankyrin repeat protein